MDLSQSDTQEIRDLYQSLSSMFPTTPNEYLEEQAEELAGKPAALERFITEHLARNSQPPDYWQPKVQNVTKIEPTSDVIENAGVVNLSREGQGINMTMDAMETDVVVAEQTIIKDPPPDELEIPVDEDPKPGTSKQKTAPIPPVPDIVNSTANNETIDLTDGIEPIDVDPVQPGPSGSNFNQLDSEEDRANKRLETLVTLFPQADPEFLHAKAVEFGDNEDQMNRWIQETLENNSANTFPSRKDYEKRQKEGEIIGDYQLLVLLLF